MHVLYGSCGGVVDVFCRCENEKMLMAMYGVDSEGGEDIPQQGRSYFLDLLQQGGTLVTSVV